MSQPQPKLGDIINKLGVQLARDSIKCQELAENVSSAREVMITICQNYEQIIQEKDAKIETLQAELKPKEPVPETKNT